MVSLFLALGAVFLLLVMAEYLRRKNIIKGEISRKFVHITVGSFVAFWPFFLTWNEIRLMCVAFIVVVLIDRHLHVLKSVHSVKRKTVGDILFPVGIGLATYISSSPWIFTIAVLHLSLGDGIAAIIGQTKGRNFAYTIFRQKKSTAGNVAFWLVSVMLTSALLLFMPVELTHVALPLLFILPITTTILESLSIFGMDNVTVPAYVALALSMLQSIG